MCVAAHDGGVDLAPRRPQRQAVAARGPGALSCIACRCERQGRIARASGCAIRAGFAVSVLRQGRHFVLVGVVQWLLDWGVLVALSHAGAPVEAANIAGRVSGAVLGFWLNGNITFARDGEGPGWRQFLRYALLWGVTTLLSTGAISALNAASGLRAAWLGKPLIDGFLSIGSFVASRYWIYR
jgi:putative flippase GtrA